MFLLNKVVDSLSQVSANMSVGRRHIGAAIARIVLGAVTAVLYGLHFSQRQFLWGANGVITQTDFSAILKSAHAWSLYSWYPSAFDAEVLYWLGLLVSLMFAVGLFTRVTSVLFFIFTWSIYQRNVYALDGGDNLLLILIIYLFFADLSVLSLDRLLFKRHQRQPGRFAWFFAMLHNFAITACMLQLAIVYFDAGFYKIQGHVWSNGTAIYYILRSNGFALPGWSDFIWKSAAIVTIGTYGTILFEIMHPFLMWHRKLKYLIFTEVVFFHASIGVLMGLVWFAITMIGVHAVLFDDDEFLRLHSFLKTACGKMANLFRRKSVVQPSGVEEGIASPVPSPEWAS
jgi:hypothetical protein